MAKNSLFAVLLRAPWWISLAIALMLGLLSLALLPDRFRVVGVLSGLPFAVIAVIAAYRQWHLPSESQVVQMRQALAAMAWPGFRRDGYAVRRGKTEAVDFELERQGRLTMVCARRWKSARTGLEVLRALQAAREAADAADALYIGLGPISDTALAFATEQRISIWQAAGLAYALRGLPMAQSPAR
jgi:restriction system protein